MKAGGMPDRFAFVCSLALAYSFDCVLSRICLSVSSSMAGPVWMANGNALNITYIYMECKTNTAI